jgi:hypothetical protein
MTVIFVLTLSMFAWSAQRRWRLLQVTAPDPTVRLDRDELIDRVANIFTYVLGQKKMPAGHYQTEGYAHMAIFLAFQVLLLNTILLWGRGFDPDFTLFGILAEDHLLGQGYSLLKELAAAGAIVGGRLRLLPGDPPREAHDAVRRGPARPRHHHHHDDRRLRLRGRAARPRGREWGGCSGRPSDRASAGSSPGCRAAPSPCSSTWASGGTRPGCSSS